MQYGTFKDGREHYTGLFWISIYILLQLAVLDADGYAVCPDCGTRVKCGSVWLANLEKRHRKSDACKTARDKHDKEQKKKNTSLFKYFKGPKAPAVPSTIIRSEPVQSHRLTPLQVISNSFSMDWNSLFWIVSSTLRQAWNKATKMALCSVRGIWANSRREAPASMM